MNSTQWSVGVDVGGTKSLAILLDAAGSVVAEHRTATQPGAAAVAAGVVSAVRVLAARVGLRPDELAGVGVGIPGVVDPRHGTVQNAVNLGIENGTPLGAVIAEQLGAVRVRVENDLNAAVLGAAHLINAAGEGPVDDLGFIALGTGLAAGLMLDGRLRRGPHLAAGEIGHLRYVPNGLPCKCGQTGCLEQYASGSAIDALWPSRTGRPAPAELFEAADAGDPRAIEIRQDFIGAVAAAVRVLVLTCDVDRIVIGGGVSSLGAPLLDALVAELDRQALTSPFLAGAGISQRVRLAPLGVPVGAVGAALVGREEF